MIGRDEALARRLRLIASILGIPVDRLHEDDPPQDLEDAEACVELWYRLKTREGRTIALEYLRKIAEEEGN